MDLLAEKHMKVEGNSLPTQQKIIWVNHLKEGKKKHEIVIPRYLPWTGWVEIFFLSPQEKWLELTNLQDFSGSGKGSINGDSFEERVSWKRDLNSKNLRLKVERHSENSELLEKGEYYETWKDFPAIQATWESTHKEGSLKTDLKEKKLEEKDLISLESRKFIEASKNRIKRNKKEKVYEFQIWRKEWKSEGKLPEWKKSLAPIPIVQSGSSLEIGFIYMQGHGDWYKIMEYADGSKYLIIEEGFEWDRFNWQGKNVQGKRNFHLFLYKIKDLEEAVEILNNKNSGLS